MVTVVRAVLWREAREQAAILIALLAMGVAVVAATAQLADPASALGPLDFKAYIEAPRMAALMLTMTAGVVVGGALFAGEREVGTWGYVELLPARRGRIWVAKVAAGLVLAGGCGAVLMGAGAAAGALGPEFVGVWVLWGVVVGLAAYGWGAFGSAFGGIESTLAACGVGLLAAGLFGLPMLLAAAVIVEAVSGLGGYGGGGHRNAVMVMQLAGFLMLVLPLLLSAAVFTAPDRDRRRTAVAIGAVTAHTAAVRRRVTSGGGSGLLASLWLANRQARGYTLIGGVFAAAVGLAFLAPDVQLLAGWPAAAAFAGAMAGVLGWADEQGRGAYRFWGERRLPAGRLWLAKLVVGAAVTLTWCVLLFAPSLIRQLAGDAPERGFGATFRTGLFLHTGSPWVELPRGPGPRGFFRTLYSYLVHGNWCPPPWVYHLVLWPIYGFAFGHLSGLLFRKTVVAAGVAVLTAGPLAGLWLPSVFSGGLKPWQVLPVPLLALLLARVLMRAWGADRLGTRRPILAIVVAGVLAVGFTTFALGWRAVEVPEIAETEDDLTFAETVPQLDSPDGGREARQAVELFRQIDSRVLSAGSDEPLVPNPAIVFRTPDLPGGADRSYLAQLPDLLLRHGYPDDRPDVDRWLEGAFRTAWEGVLIDAAGKPVGPLENPRTITLATAGRPLNDGRAAQMALLMLARGLRMQARDGDPLSFLPRFDAALALARNLRRQEPGPVFAQGLTVERLALAAGERWLERLGHRPDLLHAAELMLLRHDDLCPRDPAEADQAGQMINRESVRTPSGWAPTTLAADATRTGLPPDDRTKARADTEANLLAFCWQVPWERERLRRLVGLGNNVAYQPDRHLLARGLYRMEWDWVRVRYFYPSVVVMQTAQVRCLLGAVAARRFEAERGRPPAGWDDLIGDYLPAAPLDPFTAGKPLGYRVSPGETIDLGIETRSPGGVPQPGIGILPSAVFPPEAEEAAGAVVGGWAHRFRPAAQAPPPGFGPDEVVALDAVAAVAGGGVCWPANPEPIGMPGGPSFPEPKRTRQVESGRPIVWSVGPDGRDGFGTVVVPRNEYGIPLSNRGDVIVVVPAAGK